MSLVSRTVVAIVVATFFSDVGHEAVTAVLPLYIGSVGLGAAALGAMEGVADFAFSTSKLAGGWIGHRAGHKRPWAIGGYALTLAGTGAMALTPVAAVLVALRGVAWFGRGFRSPLRDAILADAVPKSHFGRVYGVERTADMLGALVGPLLALGLAALGATPRTVILASIVPSAIAVLSIAMTREEDHATAAPAAATAARPKLPRAYWMLLVGVLLFGLGDFSRSFLILLAAKASGAHTQAVLLYCVHNAVSALAAYPAGRIADRTSRRGVLVTGYALGVVTNALLAFVSANMAGLAAAIVLSGVYIAVEETVEKATVAELLPSELRSLGFGVLACANALGDMLSSLWVGFSLEAGATRAAFLVPACASALGTLWLLALGRRPREAT